MTGEFVQALSRGDLDCSRLTKPRYQKVQAARIPRAQTLDGRARGVVIAGEALGVRAVIATITPIVYQDWTLDPGADVSLAIPPDHRVMVYAFEGAIEIDAREVRDGQLAVLGAGESVQLRASRPGRVLLLAGVPHQEPVARYGPFLMNTQEELVQAISRLPVGTHGRDHEDGAIG